MCTMFKTEPFVHYFVENVFLRTVQENMKTLLRTQCKNGSISLTRFLWFCQLWGSRLVDCKRTAGRRPATAWYWSLLWLSTTSNDHECWRWSSADFSISFFPASSIAWLWGCLPVYFRFVELCRSIVTACSVDIHCTSFLRSALW